MPGVLLFTCLTLLGIPILYLKLLPVEDPVVLYTIMKTSIVMLGALFIDYVRWIHIEISKGSK